ncbi:MAG TPA: S-layer homology domain-containing protein [Chloroflexia bacterium]|nr:S-layer homology domain-containing protein [Chloroflexia bacterium]
MKRLILVLIAAVALMAAMFVTRAGDHATAAPAARPQVTPVFGPNVRANSDGTPYGQHEPSLAVSRVHTNTVVVAQKDYREGNVKHVWIETSTDGGITWPANRQFLMPGVNLNTFPIQSDAVVMARDDGRIYVACLATNGGTSNGAVLITWTDDDGATWHNPSVQTSPTDPFLDDKNWFAIDNNPASPYYHRMYMMYAPNASYVVEQHSTDGGLTWTPRQTISSSNTEYTYPVVGSDGAIYNFMMNNWGGGQQGLVQLTKSTNGGATWTAPTGVSIAYQPGSPIRTGDQFRFFSIISAAVDPNNSTLYASWTDRRNIATNGTDVLYVKSTDRGATWSAPDRLSHDPAGVVRDHITPMMVVGADSRVHAFWLDRRLDPTNHLFDSWYSSSTDGGATWDPDTRVSTQSQDLNIGFPPGSGNAAGDYWGLDTAGDTVYAAWNDTRDGVQQDIYVAKGLLSTIGGATPTASPAPPTATRTAVVPPSSTSTPGGPTETPAPPSATAPPATATAPPATNTPPPPATAPPSQTPTVQPCSMPFTDVTPNDPFYTYVQYLYCRGVVSGYSDNTFRPFNDTTRAQMIKIVVLGFSMPIVTPPTGNTFADVPSTHPFFAYIETAAARGIISGYSCGGVGEPCDGANRPYFRPYSSVTRGQLSKITVISAGWVPLDPPTGTFADVAPGSPFYTYVEAAACHAIISGYNCGGPGEPCDPDNRPYFRQGNNAVRSQIAKLVYLALTNPPGCTLR